MHKWGSTREGWEGGMMSFGAIPITSTMVVRVIWYKCVGIRIENLWTIASMKLLDCYVKDQPCADEYLYSSEDSVPVLQL